MTAIFATSMAGIAGKLLSLNSVTYNSVTSIMLAQTGSGVTGQLRQGFSLALGIMFMFGFLWGVIKIWAGANAIAKGDPDGKAGIVAGIIIAGAAAIMSALFSIFGMSAGALTPTF